MIGTDEYIYLYYTLIEIDRVLCCIWNDIYFCIHFYAFVSGLDMTFNDGHIKVLLFKNGIK